MKTRVQVIISGRVQGVWYRASTKQKAEELGVSGWVKNTGAGTVEAEFEGDESTVQAMIAWCWRGPPLAKVSDVKIVRQSTGGKCLGFVILRD
jgi:acylphosphatase